MNIIAYGSLMNLQSLEKSLQRKSSLQKIIFPGFIRVFDAPFGDYSFLNLKQKKGVLIEAAYFRLQEKELAKFAEREKGSELIEVIPNFFAFVWPDKYCKFLPVLQSYINVCQKGADNLDIDLWKGTEIPDIIKDDTKDPLY